MFNQEEITYMKKIGLNLDYHNLSDDNYALIEEVVGDELQNELDDDYNPTINGKICESILDKLPI